MLTPSLWEYQWFRIKMNKTTKFRFVIILWPILRFVILFGWRPKRVFSLKMAICDFDRWLSSVARHHNDYIAAKVGKSAFQAGVRLAFGLQPLPQSGPMWYRTCAGSAFPSRLWRIRNLLVSRRVVSRVLGLTVLACFRLISHKPVPAYGSVLNSGKSKINEIDFGIALEGLIRDFRLDRFRVRSQYDPTSVWLGSAGVSGSQNSFTPDFDAYVLLQGRFRRYLDAVLILLDRFDHKGEFAKWIRTLSFFCGLGVRTGSTPPESLGRLVFISEGGSKTRGVSPISYFLQVALLPYHEFFMTLLRQLPMDCSFNEIKGRMLVKSWSSRGLRLDSVDLTSATDRFPRAVLRLVVARFLGDRIASSWAQLMSLPLAMGHTRKRERPFAVGAPMGIYCLWPVFSLAHHVLVQWSALLAGRKMPFRLYVLRGDDIVFADHEVVPHYLHLLDLLDCPVSLGKTFLSSRDGPGVAEFAKSLWSWGSDLSPLSVRQLVACRIVDPFSSLGLINRLCDLVQLRDSGNKQVTLPSVLSLFVRSVSVRRDVVRYLSLPWNRDSFSIPSFLQLPLPLETSLASSRTLSRVADRMEKDLARDLLSEVEDLSHTVLHRMIHDLPDFTPPLQEVVRNSFPVFRKLRSLGKELEDARAGSLWLSPAFRFSKLYAILRSLKALGREPSMSRRNARFLLSSRYSRSIFRYIGPHGRAQLYH